MIARRLILAFIVSNLIYLPSAPAQPRSGEELRVGPFMSDEARLDRILPDYLQETAWEYFAERQKTIAAIRTPEDLRARQKYIRESILSMIGGLPFERTPLNARTTGKFDRGDYRVENVIFESQPGFHVTANLYLPRKTDPPVPAVLEPCGHSYNGKASYLYQKVAISLARKGIAVLVFDPVSQGERYQYYNQELGRSVVGGPTAEHNLAGFQCLLAGFNLASIMTWDGIRAIDYLVSRPEVDSSRIGVTGNSGGGTQTSYIMSLDPRIKAAAPSCYITSLQELWLGQGPQDAEQDFTGTIARGIDHADFLTVFAPKPALVCSAIQDFFPIAGARASFAEAKSLYGVLGKAEMIDMVEADDRHGFTLPRRQGVYGWMTRWLIGGRSDSAEPESPAEPDRSLQCTRTGQVITDLEGRTITDLIRRRAESRLKTKKTLDRKALADTVRRLLAYRPADSPLNVKTWGTVMRDDIRIERITYESEPGIIVPGLLFSPLGPQRKLPATVYVNRSGKSADSGPGGAIATLVKSGRIVLAVDPRGWGETENREPRPWYVGEFLGPWWQNGMALRALWLDRTLPGMRVLDIIRGIDHLAGRPDVDPDRISGFGVGPGATLLLHTACLDNRLNGLALSGGLASFLSVVDNRFYRQSLADLVPGCIGIYDLPDLAAAHAPKPLVMVNTTDQLGAAMDPDQVKELYRPSVNSYRKADAADKFQVRLGLPDRTDKEIYADWIGWTGS